MSGRTERDERPMRDRLRLDDETGGLLAGRCGNCGTAAWPHPLRCPTCGSAQVAAEALPVCGTIETWTRVWVALPDVPSPYNLARVRLGDCCVYGRVEEGDSAELVTGQEVTLRPLDGEPGAPVRFVFTAAGASRPDAVLERGQKGV